MGAATIGPSSSTATPAAPASRSPGLRLPDELSARSAPRTRRASRGASDGGRRRRPLPRPRSASSATNYADRVRHARRPAGRAGLRARPRAAAVRERYGDGKFAAEPAPGPPAGRGRRLARDGQLRRRDRRRQGLTVLGHAPPELPLAEGPPGPPLRPGLLGVPRGPRRPRAAGDDAGRRHRRVRPDPEDRPVRAEQHDREDRPRPLAARLHRPAGRRRRPRRARSTARPTRSAATSRTAPSPPPTSPATILHHLGIDHRREYWDEFQQVPRRLSEGRPIADLA